MAQKKGTNSSGAKKAAIGLGVGVTAAMVAAAGAYFLYGSKDAAKNRRQVKSWMLKAKAEVLEGIEGTKDISKDNYDKLVDTAVAGYGKLRAASKPELEALRKELKSHWKYIEQKGKRMAQSGAKPKAAARRSTKSSAKKSSAVK